MSSYHYLDISLELEENASPVSAVYFKNLIVHSLKTLFGDVGASINVDVLKYNEDSRRAVLRCPAKEYVKVRGALTLCGIFKESPCRFIVHQSSSLLLSLLGNSRNYIHCW